MSSDRPTSFQRALTWLSVAIAFALLVVGTLMHGFSIEVQQRFWADMIDRLHGPMTFRFYLQPAMALLAALPDGIDDARHGHSAFFWTGRSDPAIRHGRLRQAAISIARVVLLGISMDVIYQLRVFDQFYPVEALMMAILLAVVPYFIFRWIVERVARWWLARGSAVNSK